MNILRTNYYKKELLKLEKTMFKPKNYTNNPDPKIQEFLQLKGKKEHLTMISKKQWDIINQFLKRDRNSNYTGDINVMNSFFANIGSNLALKIPDVNDLNFKQSTQKSLQIYMQMKFPIES